MHAEILARWQDTRPREPDAEPKPRAREVCFHDHWRTVCRDCGDELAPHQPPQQPTVHVHPVPRRHWLQSVLIAGCGFSLYALGALSMCAATVGMAVGIFALACGVILAWCWGEDA